MEPFISLHQQRSEDAFRCPTRFCSPCKLFSDQQRSEDRRPANPETRHRPGSSKKLLENQLASYLYLPQHLMWPWAEDTKNCESLLTRDQHDCQKRKLKNCMPFWPGSRPGVWTRYPLELAGIETTVGAQQKRSAQTPATYSMDNFVQIPIASREACCTTYPQFPYQTDLCQYSQSTHHAPK